MNEKLCKLKAWLLSCSYPLETIWKAFLTLNYWGPPPKKEEIYILFVSINDSNFNSRSISITVNSSLSNVKDKKLEKGFQKCTLQVNLKTYSIC